MYPRARRDRGGMSNRLVGMIRYKATSTQETERGSQCDMEIAEGWGDFKCRQQKGDRRNSRWIIAPIQVEVWHRVMRRWQAFQSPTKKKPILQAHAIKLTIRPRSQFSSLHGTSSFASARFRQKAAIEESAASPISGTTLSQQSPAWTVPAITFPWAVHPAFRSFR